MGRKAGIKSMSIECVPIIRNFVNNQIRDIMSGLDLICESNDRKVITENDLVLLMELNGENFALSSKIGTKVLGKN